MRTSSFGIKAFTSSKGVLISGIIVVRGPQRGFL